MQLSQFSPDSKIWIYQSARPFNDDEIELLNRQLVSFAKQWTAHNMQLHATGFVYKDRVVVLMVDESKTEASGCSIDKSVHFIKELEQQFNTGFFDRMLVNYFVGEELKTITLHELKRLTAETIVIDPLVQTKKEFDERFISPVKNTWMLQYAQ